MEIKSKLKKNKKLRQRGRQVNFEIREELIKLLDVSNYRRDHLIEYLHVIQDNKGHINDEFMETQEEVNLNFLGNYERLVEIKNKYDPTNLFRLNANIKPSV